MRVDISRAIRQLGMFPWNCWGTRVDVAITSAAQLVAIAGAMAAQTQAAYAASWARKASLEWAETVEAVEAV